MGKQRASCSCRCHAAPARRTDVPLAPSGNPMSSALLTAEGRRVLLDSTVSHIELSVRSLASAGLKRLRFRVPFRKKTQVYKVGSVCLHL